jgi:hypothetical protein
VRLASRRSSTSYPGSRWLMWRPGAGLRLPIVGVRSSLWSVDPHLHGRVPEARGGRRGNCPGGLRATARVPLPWYNDRLRYPRSEARRSCRSAWTAVERSPTSSHSRPAAGLPEPMASAARRTCAPASLTPSRVQSGATSLTDAWSSLAPRLADQWGSRLARVAPRRRLGR